MSMPRTNTQTSSLGTQTPAAKTNPPARTPLPGNPPLRYGELRRHFADQIDSHTQRVIEDRVAVMDELKAWGAGFTVKMPVPRDLLPLMARGEEKQGEILVRNVVHLMEGVGIGERGEGEGGGEARDKEVIG